MEILKVFIVIVYMFKDLHFSTTCHYTLFPYGIIFFKVQKINSRPMHSMDTAATTRYILFPNSTGDLK